MDVLGESEGFVDSTHCDLCVFVGDFNVDFDHNDSLKSLLVDFVDELDLSVCDLSYKDTVQYTYQRDDSLSCSWIFRLAVSLISFLTFILCN